MSDIVESLHWLKQQIKADAESKGFSQGSAGAEFCQEAIEEIDSLRQQLTTTERLLAESQAREKVKDEALQMFVDCDAFIPSLVKQSDDDAEQDESRRDVVYSAAVRAIQMPSDSTALDAAIAKAKREVLLEAADIADAGVVEGNHGNDVMTRHNIGSELRRMIDELKGGEQ